MKPAFILLLKSGAIAGNALFILWVTYNAIDDHFSGTVPEKISYIMLMALLVTNCFLLIRSFKGERRQA
jgi:Flp pilus assembly protein protease CpaA